MELKFLLAAFFLCVGFYAPAQEATGLDSALHNLAQEKDPAKAVKMMNSIINQYKLDKTKDAETFDVLYGTVAVNYAMQRNYPQFEKYIGLIRNKFNQTSFLNMAATQMLNNDVDAPYANRIAKKTLALYQSFKDDTTARPNGFSQEDWNRFIGFAKYPYYDTYAQSLFALKKYDEALQYQKMAFEDSPEKGLPASVERYAQLLTLTGNREEAKQLLLKRARLGKINKGMTGQLQSIYLAENGTDENLGKYLDSLQKNVQAAMMQDLKTKMLDETAPGFSLKDINGKEVKLSDFAGRIVVLDLWATWCRPCIASFPAMQLMVQKHPEVTFLFIAVQEKDKDPLPKVKSFIEKRKYPFTVLLDEPVQPNAAAYKILSAYKPDGIPTKYIIDKNGKLQFVTSGFDTDAELINELEAMISVLQNKAG
ncbi:MAG: redoxin domain-containing protein [Flavisolibacter sp.]|jgi:peroxiredoxin